MTTPLPADCNTLIVGGGVVGLSMAYELARRGIQAVVIDRQQPGLEASWAGAGILPPGSWYDDHPALESLAAVSARLNAEWSDSLAEQTGIDNQFRITGALHLAENSGEEQRLTDKFKSWALQGIDTACLPSGNAIQVEPNCASSEFTAAYHVPGEGQIDNRRHVSALLAACEQLGVIVRHPAELLGLKREANGGYISSTSAGNIVASRIVLTTGAWSASVGRLFDVQLAVRPLRGQMLEFVPATPGLLAGNVHCADRYIIPRRDGRLIVGSTVEDVGFDKQAVPEQIALLEAFARRLVPGLAGEPVAKAWAGLRPASADGLPYIGAVPDWHNTFVATGHFRAGLQLASGTAVALADLMTGIPLSTDLEPFRVDR